MLHDLPEIWCALAQRHYLGPRDAFLRMRSAEPTAFAALEIAMRPAAALSDIERAVGAIVGARPNTMA